MAGTAWIRRRETCDTDAMLQPHCSTMNSAAAHAACTRGADAVLRVVLQGVKCEPKVCSATHEREGVRT